MRSRVVEPEILDSLPFEDPEAKRSRRDLRFINFMMGNFRWVERQLGGERAKGEFVELGSGDGTLLRRLASDGVQVSGVDLAPRPKDLPESAVWRQGDLFEVSGFAGVTVVANLFLHHFDREELQRLGDRLAEADRLVFSEPWRSPWSLFLGYLLFPFVNRVTRHDMMVSIRAGFRPGELKECLGLDVHWSIEESIGPMGACRLVATRR